MADTCSQHAQMLADYAVVKNDVHYIRSKVCRHVEDGEKEGGFRDRLLIAEREIAELKKRFWASSLIGGVIGALIGSGSKDVICLLVRWLIGDR